MPRGHIASATGATDEDSTLTGVEREDGDLRILDIPGSREDGVQNGAATRKDLREGVSELTSVVDWIGNGLGVKS